MAANVDRQGLRSQTAAEEDEGPARDRRETILDAAWRVIRERGLAQTRTSHIAHAADCAEGSIYRYFANKSELVRAVMHSRLRAMITLVADLPARAGSATVQENLLEIADAALAFYREGAPLLGGLLGDTELLATEREFLSTHGRGPHAVAANLAAYLQAEQDLGRVRRDADVEVAARLLLASCLGESFFRVLDADVDATDQDRFLRVLIEVVAAYLISPTPNGGGDQHIKPRE